MATNQELFSSQIAQRLGSRAIPVPSQQASVGKGSTQKFSGTKAEGGKSSGSSKSKRRKKPKNTTYGNDKVAENPINVETLRQILQGGGIVHEIKPSFLQRHIVDPIQDMTVGIGPVPTPILNPLGVARRAGDLASRPLNALAEGTRRYISDTADEGNPFTAADDVWRGIGEGLGGYKKTGFGDVGRQLIEDQKILPNPDWLPARELTMDLLDPQGVIKKQLDINKEIEAGREPTTQLQPWEQERLGTDLASLGYLGLAGDLVLDPLNLVGGGVIKATRGGVETAEGARGIEALRDISKSTVAKTLEESALPISKSRTAAPARITDAINAKLEQTALELSGGPNIGKVVGADRTAQHTAALAGATATRAEMTADFDRAMSKFVELKDAGALTDDARKALRKNPYFRQWEEEIPNILKEKSKTGQIPKKYLTKSGSLKVEALSDDIFHEAAMRVRSSFDEETRKVYKSMVEAFNRDMVKRPGFKLGDKQFTVGSKKFWGKVNTATDWLRDTALGRAFSFERHAPGVSGAIASGAKTSGVRWADDIHSEFLHNIGDLTRQEDELLHRARLTGEKFAGDLGEKQKILDEYYNQLWDLQVRAGLENVDKIPNKNYAFEYFSGKDENIKAARALRKKLLESGDPDWYAKFQNSTQYSKVRSLSKSARQNYIYHVNDVIRQLVRQEMRDRLISTYGIKAADISDELLATMPMKRVRDLKDSRGFKIKLTPTLEKELAAAQKSLGKGAMDWYLDDEAANILLRFEEWSKLGNNPETDTLLRGLDRLTRFVKTTNTVPFPPYHIRNMITDYITGSMDGVKFADWEEVAGKQAKLTGFGGIKKDPTVTVNLGGHDILYSRMREAYDSTAGSVGFYRTDLPASGTTLRSHLSGVGEKAKGLSQKREDWGRIAHFKHALTEEYPAALSRYKSESKAWEVATQAAAYRVNKYHADYGALTNFEGTVMKRAIPFYTYSRRMIPVMAESMFMNPSYWVVGNKLQKLQAGVMGEEQPPNWYTRPEWMNEIGYSSFPNSSWGIAPNSLLPTGILQQWIGKNPQDTVKNFVSSANPMLRLATDIAYEKDAFTGKENKGITGPLLNLLRPYTTGQKLLSPGSSSRGEQALRTGLGLPFYELNQARKDSAAWENRAEVQAGMDQLDAQLREKGYGIYVSGDPQVIRIVKRDRDGKPKEYLYEGDDMRRAAKILEEILNGS